MKKIAWVLGAVFSACFGLSARATVTTNNINSASVTISTNGDYFVYGTGAETANTLAIAADAKGVNLTISNVCHYGGSWGLTLNTGASVNLTLVSTNRFVLSSDGCAVRVLSGATLTVGGDGSLLACGKHYAGKSATTGTCGPGIGGWGTEQMGTLVVNSGTIVAVSDSFAAGIGGGFGGGSGAAAGGTVIINGGDVTAIGASGGAGIGGGLGNNGSVGAGGSVTITGGRVYASTHKDVYSDRGQLNYGAAIGGACSRGSTAVGAAGTLTISGGMVILDPLFGNAFGCGAYANNLALAPATTAGGMTVTGGTVLFGGNTRLYAAAPISLADCVVAPLADPVCSNTVSFAAATTNGITIGSGVTISNSAPLFLRDVALLGAPTLAAGATLAYAGTNSAAGIILAGAAMFEPVLATDGTVGFTLGAEFSGDTSALTVRPVITNWVGTSTLVTGSGVAPASWKLDSSLVKLEDNDLVARLAGDTASLNLVIGEGLWHNMKYGPLVITENKTYYVKGTNTASYIWVSNDVTDATLVISNANIKAAASTSPLMLTTNTALTLTLVGTNMFQGSTKFYPAVFLPDTAALTINGVGCLVATGYTAEASSGIGCGDSPYGNATCSGSLVIDSGEVYAYGYQGSAGIGGTALDNNTPGSCGPVTINGGTVYAWAERLAAGIGGSYAYASNGGNCSNVVVNGGTLTAIGHGGAGIGGGCSGYTTSFTGGSLASYTQNGGIVTATALPEQYHYQLNGTSDQGIWGAGIGSTAGRYANNWSGSCGTVTINGGTLVATGTKVGIGSGENGGTSGWTTTGRFGSVTVTGGTVTANGSKWSIGCCEKASSTSTNLQSVVVMGGSLLATNGIQIAVTNASGTALFCVTSPASYFGGASSPYHVAIEAPGNPAYTYSYAGVGHESDTNLYLWLPAGGYAVPTNDQTFLVSTNGSYGPKPQIYLLVGDSGVTLPYSWLMGKVPGVNTNSYPAISNALATVGKNGVGFWQSYVLGLDPTNADSRILCDAAQDANTGTVTVNALNAVPPVGSGATVKYVLEKSTDQINWSNYSSELDTASTNITLEAAAPVYYRFRADIVL